MDIKSQEEWKVLYKTGWLALMRATPRSAAPRRPAWSWPCMRQRAQQTHPELTHVSQACQLAPVTSPPEVLLTCFCQATLSLLEQACPILVF